MQTNEVISISRDQVIPTAEKMRAEGRLLVMIHAHLDGDGTPVVSYDYDGGANLISCEVRGEFSLPTISPVYDAAASWAEREISELLPITFEGLDCTQRLFLPESMLEGQGQITVTSLKDLREKNNL